MAKMIAAAALLLPLSGCPFLPHPDASISPAIPCTIGAPPLGQTDRLSAPMARWTLTVIKSGQSLCGWKAPK